MNIDFVYLGEYFYNVCKKPYPAKKNLPSWYIDMPRYIPSEDDPSGKKLKMLGKYPNHSPKKCIPMLDAMTSGYIVDLWSDVLVETSGEGFNIEWKVSSDIFINHGPLSEKVTPPPGYSNVVLKFISGFYAKTPKGYSTLIVSPLGHNNLPFHAIPAVVDTDKSELEFAFPVWVKKDLNGIVEKGTPMVQMIPFKRQSWTSSSSYLKDGEYRIKEDSKLNSVIKNHYMKNIWSKKDYK